MEEFFRDQGEESKDSSIAVGRVLTGTETILKNKSVLALTNNKIVVGLRTFQPTLVPEQVRRGI